MTQKKFSAGDLVKLKSGGPAMTVEAYSKDYATGSHTENLTCNWFAGAKAESRVFHQDSLVAFDAAAEKKKEL